MEFLAYFWYFLGIFTFTRAQDDMGILLTLQSPGNLNNLVTVIGEPNPTNTDTLGYIRIGDPALFLRSCDVDYKRRRIFLFDGDANSILIGTNFNTTFSRVGTSSAMSFNYIHYGVSRDYTRLAYDWLADNLYWTDPVHKTIGVQSVRDDDSYNYVYRIIVNDHLEMPTGIAVDPINRLLFWVDRAVPKIEKSDLSGSEGSRELLVTRALYWPSAIAADLAEQRLYWTDFERDTIESVLYTGADRRFIKRIPTANLYDIAVFQNLILTTDVQLRRLWYVDKDPTLAARMIYFNPPDPIYGVSVYHPDIQPDGPNFCASAPCSDICVNDVAATTGYTCLCREQFKLDVDKATCVADETKLHRSILLSNKTNICSLDIRALSVHAYDVDCFYTQANDTTATGNSNDILFLDFDSRTRQIYFATSTKVEKLNMDGTQTGSDTLSEISTTVTGLSYDWADHVLYVSTSGSSSSVNSGSVLAVSVDTKDLATEKTNIDNPFNVLVVPLERKLFWLSRTTSTAGSTFAIQSAEIGADKVTTIITSNALTDPKDLAYDLKRERLFWYDNYKIQSCKYDGSDIGLFYNTPYDGYLLTVYKDYVVWLIEAGDITVMSSEHMIQPIQIHQKFFTNVGAITDFNVIDEDMQPKQKGPCHAVNNPCQQLCLSTKNSAVCHCEFGYQTTNNGRTCTSAPVQNNFILLSDWTHNRMYQIDNAAQTVHAVATPLTEQATTLVYNPNTQKIIWSSNQREEVIEVNLDGTGETVLGKIGEAYVEKIVVDETSGNVFYAATHVRSLIATNYSYIGVMNPEGLHTRVIESLHYPGGLAIDAAYGLLFYTEIGNSGPRIGKSWMDGSEHTLSFVFDNLYSPTGLAVDYQARRLYWADPAFNEIVSVDYFGDNRQIIVQDPGATIVDVHLDADFIYYIVSANCQPNNGKADCSVFCLPSASGGTVCACQEGYTLQPDGKTCDNGVDDCLGVTCLNGATCLDKIDNFTCQCVPGFTGQYCDINIDECSGVTCLNGGSCVDNVNAFRCQCVSGYSGTLCETNVYECLGVTCQNGATCRDGINEYTCQCLGGYTGQHCEVDIDDCATVTCKNGGTCKDGVKQYTCQCVPGYRGTHCEEDIDECIGVTCQNGGTCHDAVNSYFCQCAVGYTGPRCENNIDDCVGVTCQNGGTCKDGVNQYTCQCVPGYRGLHCEEDINECDGVVCENGGTCQDGVNRYTCLCVLGYNGTHCETDIDACAGVTCQNGGTCQDGVNQYMCQCVLGYNGGHCENNIDDCAGVTCQQNGTCQDGVNQYTCICVDEYSGTHCETDIDNCVGVDCKNGGTCQDGVNKYTCQCVLGYSGPHCETNLDDCKTVVCQHGGSCVDGVNEYTCRCKPGYNGVQCETNIDDCIGITCQNGGTCQDGVNEYTCQCVNGFNGQHCEININDCAGVSCQNNGTCQDDVNDFTCQCAAGYSGRRCQTNIDDCADVTCQNRGTCVDGVNSYICRCGTNFTGPHCEISITTTTTAKPGEAAAAEGTSIAPIIGGSVAALIVLALAAAALLVFLRRRKSIPHHERLQAQHSRTDSLREKDQRVSQTPDPEKKKTRSSKGSDVNLRKEPRTPSVRSARHSRPVSDNEIAYLGMTNPVYDMYSEEVNSAYAPSMISYAPLHAPSHYTSYAPSVVGSYAPSYVGSHAPSRSGSRPPSIAYSDTYASIHSSQMGDYSSRDGDRRERRSSSKRRK